MTVTKIKKRTNLLATIPLLSFSVVSLNFIPAGFGTTATAKNPQGTPALLIAQQTTCNVTNIQTGQLALRLTPNGRSRAGLDNGNTVALLKQGSAPWVYVRVLKGPNRRVNGLEGWVNSDYLDCNQ